MKKQISLGENFNIDLPALMETRLLIQANSGGGKSWLIRRLLEQTHGQVQQIVIDLEGEFYSLREKYNYVLIGDSGDVPISVRSAALLAQRLLKLKASAIIDLSELKKEERKPFVRLFCEALMEARSPKDYNPPCLIIVDEAHQFAPEKGESEAAPAIIDVMTRGRKRQFCGVLATQRISKLSKDAAAECNNKIVGRCGLDLDMKRGAEELAFSSKEEMLSLRSLDPGEFYAFGTALTPEVKKVRAGGVETSHTRKKKAGAHRVIPAPAKEIKAMLKELADLPQEAKKQSQNVAELQKKVRELETMNTNLLKNPFQKDVAPMGVSQWLQYGQKYGYDTYFIGKAVKQALIANDSKWQDIVKTYQKGISTVNKILDEIAEMTKKRAVMPLFEMPTFKFEKQDISPGNIILKKPEPTVRRLYAKPFTVTNHNVEDVFAAAKDTLENGTTEVSIGMGEKAILTAAAQHEQDGVTREHLTILTGYKRSTRDRYIQRLQLKGFLRAGLGKLFATSEGISFLGSEFQPLPTGEALRDHLLQTLPEGERKILGVLVGEYPEAVDRDSISETTGYQRSTRDRYIQRLQARHLVEAEGRGIRAAEKLFV